MTERQTTTAQPHKMVLFRNLDYCCPNCHAPGRYTCNPLIRDGYGEAQLAEMLSNHPENESKAHHYRKGWPGVYVEMNDPLLDLPVGGICPNCGSPRRERPKKLNKMKVLGRFW